MSDSDSFIQEVSDEVRRDRVFDLIRRYGWIAALVVVLLVGGAAFNEWRKARAQSDAQAFGDALIYALDTANEQARENALDGGIGTPEAAPLLALIQAGDKLAAEDPAAAADLFQSVAGDPAIATAYSDLAALKLVLMGDDGVDAATRSQLIDRLAQPGAPYRLVAMEQRAAALAAAGDTEAARTAAEAVLQEPGLTQPIINRISQLLVILGPAPTDEGDG